MGCLTAVSLGRSAGGSYCKVRNNNMKVLDLALVALLQPPVSNKIPCYVFFKTRPSTTRRNDQCCILRVSDQCKGKCWYRMVSSHTCLNQLHDCLTPSETFGQQKFFLAARAESLYAFFSSVFKHPLHQHDEDRADSKHLKKLCRPCPKALRNRWI